MLILAFDTTSLWGGAAIFDGHKCLAQARHNGPATYSVSLFELINDILQRTHLAMRQIDLFAAANGPGSFTGIRVGLAAAQGWSHAFGRPWRGISVLEAMVEEASPDTAWAVPIIDARRGEFYAGLFHRAPRDLETDPATFDSQEGGRVLTPELLPSFLASHIPQGTTATCIMRKDDAAACAIRSLVLDGSRWRLASAFLVPAIARLAYRAETQARQPSATDVSAYYIRASDAELNWKD